MPLYNYLCADCGSFDEMRPISAYEEPAPCPQCQALAPRQLGAPMIRSASADAGGLAGTPSAPRHRLGCSCCSSGAQRPSTAEAVAAGAPKRGQAGAPSGSFLARA